MTEVCLSDVRGCPEGARVLEVAAAGNHSVLFVGSMGTGRTMLARRLPGILPPLEGPRPFRAPHHTVSARGFFGTLELPGELELAHHGVLYLDEALDFPPDFVRGALDAMRNGVTGSMRRHAACHVVAAVDACPCGRIGGRNCMCTVDARWLHAYRVERLASEFDLVLRLHQQSDPAGAPGEPSAVVQARVMAARAGLARLTLSTERTTRVAQTVAVRAGSTTVTREHLMTANKWLPCYFKLEV